MSDDQPVTPYQRRLEHTEPPSEIGFPDAGPLLYAEAYEGGRFVGYVWVAKDVTWTPRAGIILANRGRSVRFQDDLGWLTLNIDQDRDATEFMERLSEMFDGTYGRLSVGPAMSAANRESVRQQARNR